MSAGEIQLVGRIDRLWRYPVKSMLGEERETLEVNSRGVIGDRLFAVRCPDGRFGSGKNTDLFTHIPGLFRFRAEYDGDVPVVIFPDGVERRGDAPDIHSALSAVLEREVSLAREDEVSHLDWGPVHLVTRASLDWLGSRVGGRVADERRFRPNLVIDLPGNSQVEASWIGKDICIGPSARFRVREATSRCRMTTLEQDDLPRAPRVLSTLTSMSEGKFGVYLEVLEPGLLTLGDTLRLMSPND